MDFDFALKKGVMTTHSSGMRQLSLGQNEVVRVDFHPRLRVYIRYTGASGVAKTTNLFDFNETELIGIGIAVCLMLALFFYVGIYYPRSLDDEEKIEEKVIRVATVQFKPKKKMITKMRVKKKQAKKKRNIPVAKKPKSEEKKKFH